MDRLGPFRVSWIEWWYLVNWRPLDMAQFDSIMFPPQIYRSCHQRLDYKLMVTWWSQAIFRIVSVPPILHVHDIHTSTVITPVKLPYSHSSRKDKCDLLHTNIPWLIPSVLWQRQPVRLRIESIYLECSFNSPHNCSSPNDVRCDKDKYSFKCSVLHTPVFFRMNLLLFAVLAALSHAQWMTSAPFVRFPDRLTRKLSGRQA